MWNSSPHATFSNCALDTSGPIFVAGSIGGPTVIFRVSATSFAMNGAAIDLCSSSRDVALQIWPAWTPPLSH